MPNLETKYLGLTLKTPLIAGSCSLTGNLADATLMEEAGAGAIVVKSIFEEQIRSEVDHMYDALAYAGSGDAYDYLRADLPMQLGPESYINTLRELRANLKIPVIASINCIAADRWVEYARKIELAGADAIELNIYDVPDDPRLDSATIERQHLQLVGAIQSEVGIPVAVKLSPFYTGMANLVQRIDRLGVAGLVLFNRFLQPDIDIDTLELNYEVHSSHPEDQRIPLRWIAILRSLVKADISLTSGVHDAAGAVKALLVGATTVQTCSVLYRRPVGGALTEILAGLADWMKANDFDTIDDFRGRMSAASGQANLGYERAHYVRLIGK